VSAGFGVDVAILLGGVLLAIGVIASGLAARYRVPSLLMFLALGMLVGDDGFALVRFDDARLAQNISAVALMVILFEGGLTTDPAVFRRVGAPASLLAVFGAVVTAGVVAVSAWYLLDLPLETALLLGAVISSTDAAAVFAALRDQLLPARTRGLLQVESGMNDPVAVMLTVGMVEVWRADPGPIDWARFVTLQLVGGAVVGIAVGLTASWLIARFSAASHTPFGVLTLAVAAISYGAAAMLGASGFLAVYLTGVLLARARRPVRGVLTFHEGLAATAQAVLFLLLGLLVFPAELVDNIGEAMLVTAVLVLVARPAAVHALLPWFRIPHREAVLVSWAGLRGAVPVVMATIPLTAGHPDGALVFDVAFVVVVISVAVQAPTVLPLARRLGLGGDQPSSIDAAIVPVDALDADVIEMHLPRDAAVVGLRLRDVPLPTGARISVVVRNHDTFVPDGATVLRADDQLLIVCPRRVDLESLDRWTTGATMLPSSGPDDDPASAL
jgi:cell volume regulation protein A